MREKNYFRLLALLICFSLLLAAAGCSDKNGKTGQNVESESEIDAFIESVNGIKADYDKNEMTKLSVDDAVTQAKVLESFCVETPEVYSDDEYKTKVASAYQTINSIDLSKEGLNIEDGADASFNSLKQIVNTINGKF